jgi:hypothetical protein
LLVCLLYCFDEIKFELIVESVTPEKAGVQPTMALRYWIPYMDSSRFAKVS